MMHPFRRRLLLEQFETRCLLSATSTTILVPIDDDALLADGTSHWAATSSSQPAEDSRSSQSPSADQEVSSPEKVDGQEQDASNDESASGNDHTMDSPAAVKTSEDDDRSLAAPLFTTNPEHQPSQTSAQDSGENSDDGQQVQSEDALNDDGNDDHAPANPAGGDHGSQQPPSVPPALPPTSGADDSGESTASTHGTGNTSAEQNELANASVGHSGSYTLASNHPGSEDHEAQESAAADPHDNDADSRAQAAAPAGVEPHGQPVGEEVVTSAARASTGLVALAVPVASQASLAESVTSGAHDVVWLQLAQSVSSASPEVSDTNGQLPSSAELGTADLQGQMLGHVPVDVAGLQARLESFLNSLEDQGVQLLSLARRHWATWLISASTTLAVAAVAQTLVLERRARRQGEPDEAGCPLIALVPLDTP